MSRRTMMVECKHFFDPRERKAMAVDLASRLQEIECLEEEKKEAADEINERIKRIKSEVRVLHPKVRNGFEHRTMECQVDLDYETGIKYARHPETNEIVREVSLTAEERQMDIEDVRDDGGPALPCGTHGCENNEEGGCTHEECELYTAPAQKQDEDLPMDCACAADGCDFNVDGECSDVNERRGCPHRLEPEEKGGSDE